MKEDEGGQRRAGMLEKVHRSFSPATFIDLLARRVLSHEPLASVGSALVRAFAAKRKTD
jgi:hypothetical protein